MQWLVPATLARGEAETGGSPQVLGPPRLPSGDLSQKLDS